jgi:hypothetical protein
MAPPKPQVKPEHRQDQKEFTHITKLGLKGGLEIHAKPAQIWVKRGARIPLSFGRSIWFI